MHVFLLPAYHDQWTNLASDPREKNVPHWNILSDRATQYSLADNRLISIFELRISSLHVFNIEILVIVLIDAQHGNGATCVFKDNKYISLDKSL